ncbi:MAG TPA: Ig-like domain-containing protein, partial [Gemmataceae bacterium]|nr:Ig-like domain-containing protein [Gemmataceae bacterium]
MIKRIPSIAVLVAFLSFASSAAAGDIVVQPADIPLGGPHARQQLLVLAHDGGQVVGDRTAMAKFTSSNPAVAKVDEAGVVSPVADGDAVVTSSVNGQTATAKVHVSRMKEPSPWSFRNHVIAVLTKVGCNSGACHGALAGKGGMKLSLRGYDVESDYFVLTRQALARRVDQQEPAKSLMLLKPTRKLPHGGGLRLESDSADYKLILDWITSGAAAPKDNDPRIERIEVFPPSAVLKPKDTLNLVVRAWYSDGHAEDVTRWARFGSSEDQVATVNEDGLVTVAGHGEAGIHATFKNRVASLTVVSPFPNSIAATEFEKSTRNNLIDSHVLAKLQALRLPPSGPCTDREFVRRAYLDV